MEKLKLMIADSSREFSDALTQLLSQAYHIRTTRDGMQALKELRSFSPDILVIDLMLPGLDGITLLQRAAQTGITPMVLATTRYLSDYILRMAEQLGIGYIMVKPCDVSAAAQRITDLHQRLENAFRIPDCPRSQISGLLLRLGISAKLRGYHYLREAVLLMAGDPKQSITKELYPAIAAQCSCTAIQIERSIRSALHTAWRHADCDVWQRYFPADDTGHIPRPTNAAFISRLADLMTLE